MPRPPPSFPTIEIEYFDVKQAIMCSETSLQTIPILISLRRNSISFRCLAKRPFEIVVWSKLN